MHILFLSDNFPPEVNAPATRTHEHCREWVKAGHEVTVVSCVPNFPSGKVHTGWRNNRLRQTEMVDGIRVVRVWSYITANEGFLKRTLDYASYMVSATLASPFVRGVDIVVATSPQFFAACAGYVVSRILRKPFVFELRDLWPASISAVGAMREGRALRLFEKLELFLYRKADAVVSVTSSFREDLVRRGIDRTKIHVVTNGADLTRFQPRPRDDQLARALQLEGAFVAGYVGTIGMAHDLKTIVEAAHRLEASGDRGFRFILLGAGADRAALEELVRRRGLANVTFVDTVPRAEVARYWSLLDVSIIHLRRDPLFRTVLPSKLFECMAMGVPILHGVEGESAEIVLREDVGVTFEPGNVDSLCNELLRLRANPAELARFRANGPRAAMNYDRATLAAEMLGVLEAVVHRLRHPQIEAEGVR